MKFQALTVFVLFIGFSFTAHAQSISSSMLPIIESKLTAQQRLFFHLKEKSGVEAATPEYSNDALIQWSLESYKNAGNERLKLYGAVQEQLLVANQLLQEKPNQQKRRGLRLAHNANFKVSTRLRDTRLSALIFEALIVPNIEAATNGKGTLSQARLLQDAASSYRLAGESDKHVQVLERLIQVSEKDKDIDAADWARVKLADVFVAQGKYPESIALLKAVTAPNMSGAKRRIPELEAKAVKQADSTPYAP